MARRWIVVAAFGLFGSLTLAQAQTAADRTRIEQLLAQGDVSAAVDAFDARADVTRTVDATILRVLAIAVLDGVTKGREDVPASVEACFTVLKLGPHDCEPSLMVETTPSTRLRLLARRLPADPTRAQRQIADLTRSFGPDDWSGVVGASADFPPAVGVELLKQALAAGDGGVQFQAVAALRTHPGPEALAALRHRSKQVGAPGRYLALGAVAESGDGEALAAVKALLPELAGPELLSAGVALARHGDPQGFEAIRHLLIAPEELLRLEAAAALVRLGDPRGEEHLKGAFSDADGWVRLRALELARDLVDDGALKDGVQPPVWRMLNDASPWTRVRAGQLLLSSTGPVKAPIR